MLLREALGRRGEAGEFLQGTVEGGGGARLASLEFRNSRAVLNRWVAAFHRKGFRRGQ